MTNEEKQLLLTDLCARLPYGVKCRWESDGFSNEGELTDICHQEGVNGFKYWDCYLNNDGEDIPIEIIKPYLRPMSSMTEEEIFEFILISDSVLRIGERKSTCILSLEQMDWLNVRHFDFRNLIEKGLALEATDGIYN